MEHVKTTPIGFLFKKQGQEDTWMMFNHQTSIPSEFQLDGPEVSQDEDDDMTVRIHRSIKWSKDFDSHYALTVRSVVAEFIGRHPEATVVGPDGGRLPRD